MVTHGLNHLIFGPTSHGHPCKGCAQSVIYVYIYIYILLMAAHTGTMQQGSGVHQVLDQLSVERRRGITIKAHTATMFHKFRGEVYMLNLIDTPVSAHLSLSLVLLCIYLMLHMCVCVCVCCVCACVCVCCVCACVCVHVCSCVCVLTDICFVSSQGTCGFLLRGFKVFVSMPGCFVSGRWPTGMREGTCKGVGHGGGRGGDFNRVQKH